MSVENQTFPKSVQPGIPKLGPTPKGWKRHHIGDLLDVVSRPTELHDDQEYDLVTVKRSRGGIDRRSHLLGRQISVKSQYLLDEGDFLISKRQIVHGACAVVPAEFSGSIVSNEYSVLRPRPILRLNYLRYLVHSIYLQQTFFHSSVGVHVEKMIFRLEDWFKWPIHLPPVPEQEKLGKGLMDADAKITLLSDKRTELEDYKRGLMQRLFSRELRFTRDDGSAFPDWEERRLGELGNLYGGLSGKTSDDFGSGQPYVTYRQVFEAARLKVENFDYVDIRAGERQSRVCFGDVLVTTSSETPQEVGFSSVVLDQFGEVYLNSFCFGFRPNDLATLLPEFSRQLFRAPAYRRAVEKLAQGSTRYNISRTGFLKISLRIPHPDEQRKIATALSALDAKIDALSQKITEMEAFKKGLLQKLFV